MLGHGLARHRLLLPCLLAAACTGGMPGTSDTANSSSGTTSSGSTSETETGTDSGTDSGGVDEGLPCDIDEILETNCRSCHGAMPSSGAFNSMIKRSDLLADAVTAPGKTVAQAAADRITGVGAQMPPAPGAPLTSAQIDTWNNWLAAGSPAGDCTTDPEPDPFDVDPICSSDSTWKGGLFGESPKMDPGRECIHCHTTPADFGGFEGGPLFTIAGTVYPTAHEPDDCFGTNGETTDVAIVLTDAEGTELTLNVNTAGNFFAGASTIPAGFTNPIHAKVVADGAERIMVGALESGDCNSCHSQEGSMGAPGRILLP